MNLVRSLTKRHPLALFFTLAFSIAWLAKPFALTDGDLTKISPLMSEPICKVYLIISYPQQNNRRTAGACRNGRPIGQPIKRGMGGYRSDRRGSACQR